VKRGAVTGASSGIGAAIAQRFGREHMRVALAARRADLLKRVGDQVQAAGGEALVVPADMRDAAAIAHLVTMTRQAWGRIDVLVANAGIGGGNVMRMDDDALLEIVEVNLLGVIRSARAVLPVMLDRREGHIIAVASIAGKIIAPGSIYGVTKAGVLAFCEGLRRAVAESGISVSAVLRGWIDTPMVKRIRPRWMAPPAIVADAAVRLLRRPRGEVIVPGWYRIPIGLSRWIPGVTDWFFKYQMRVGRQPQR
jgi:short-subunit dehydrogenase